MSKTKKSDDAGGQSTQAAFISPETVEYINSLRLPYFINTRTVATVSGFPVSTTWALIANTLAGNNTCITGNPSVGKSQFLWDTIHTIAGEQHSLPIREELYRGDLKSLFLYLDRNAYEAAGRSDAAVQSKNVDRVLFGIEEITRAGPLQNSLFAVVDGEVYDVATGARYLLGMDVGASSKFHISIATGNLPNGENGDGTGRFAYAGQVDEALATRFHLFLDMDDFPRTESDETDIRLQRRGPQLAVSAEGSAEDQRRQLERLLVAHREIAALHREADIIEDAILSYFSMGLAHCQKHKGGKYALIEHDKRAMKHAWPGVCKSCDQYPKVKFACGAVRPAEPRHTNAWVRMRNALEAVAYAHGKIIESDHSVDNLLEAVKLMAPYTMQWNPDLIVDADCMQSNANAARGMAAAFKDIWGDVKDELYLEASLAARGKLYDKAERGKVSLAEADDKSSLMAGLGKITAVDKKPFGAIFGYLKSTLDTFNTKVQQGRV